MSSLSSLIGFLHSKLKCLPYFFFFFLLFVLPGANLQSKFASYLKKPMCCRCMKEGRWNLIQPIINNKIHIAIRYAFDAAVIVLLVGSDYNCFK